LHTLSRESELRKIPSHFRKIQSLKNTTCGQEPTMPRTRLKRTTITTANGTRVERVTVVERSVQEWEIQAEAVRRCRQLLGFGDAASPGVTFTLCGDFNAGRRGMQESVKAKATGIVAGEEDLRFYGLGGRALLVEMKGPKTPVSAEQKARHELHRSLGFQVEVVRGKTVEQGAADVVSLVRGWLAANDNVSKK
jgi:hypothetical protein